MDRSHNHQNVADPCLQQCFQWIKNHGLVVDWQKLLACHFRQRPQARAFPTGQNNAFHKSPFASQNSKIHKVTNNNNILAKKATPAYSNITRREKLSDLTCVATPQKK